MIFYTFLKFIVRIALRVFYRRYQINNRAALRSAKGPLIVAVNHPNTFMDPLIAATIMPQRVAFIANGSIFNRYTRAFFKYMHVIPVYRKKDTSDVPIPPAELNRQTFQRCYDYLENRGTLLIFPEGTSEIERRLREIKTGMARIALGAEYENKFELGVQILPIGLNYSDPVHFRSEVFVNVGELIQVADFKQIYSPDNFKAVEQLTDLIEKHLQELTIITEDEQEDSVVRQVELLYKNQLFETLNLDEKVKKDEFVLIKEIIRAVRYFEQNNPDLYKKLQVKMTNYVENLRLLGISDEVLGQSKQLYGRLAATFFTLMTGLPLYLFGLLNNYIPYRLPSRIARWISSDITYRAPTMMSLGIILFPLFYGIQIWAFQHLFQTPWLTFLYAILLPISGFWTLWYWDIATRLGRMWRALYLFRRKPSLMKTLWEERSAIFNALEEAKAFFGANQR